MQPDLHCGRPGRNDAIDVVGCRTERGTELPLEDVADHLRRKRLSIAELHAGLQPNGRLEAVAGRVPPLDDPRLRSSVTGKHDERVTGEIRSDLLNPRARRLADCL